MTQTRWKALTEWPLMAAALAFLIAYAALVLARPAGTALVVTELVMWGTWLLFAVDFVVRLVLAEQRGRWVLTHWYEVAVIMLPMLRPLRLLRLVTMVGVMQRSAGTAVRGQGVRRLLTGHRGG